MELLIKAKLKKELEKLNISYSRIDLIQNKDGVIVARVYIDSISYIIKCFQNADFKREIKNYQILKSLNISTVKVFNFTDSAIIMEDISQSDTFRLATKEDLNVLYKLQNGINSCIHAVKILHKHIARNFMMKQIL